jgi:hypothetical protein
MHYILSQHVVGASYIALECGGFLTGLGFDTTVMVCASIRETNCGHLRFATICVRPVNRFGLGALVLGSIICGFPVHGR